MSKSITFHRNHFHRSNAYNFDDSQWPLNTVEKVCDLIKLVNKWSFCDVIDVWKCSVCVCVCALKLHWQTQNDRLLEKLLSMNVEHWEQLRLISRVTYIIIIISYTLYTCIFSSYFFSFLFYTINFISFVAIIHTVFLDCVYIALFLALSFLISFVRFISLEYATAIHAWTLDLFWYSFDLILFLSLLICLCA